MLSPVTRKRFRKFWSMKRARYASIGLLSVFLFSLCADWVCPRPPGAVEDPSALDAYRTVRVAVVPELCVCSLNLDGSLAPLSVVGHRGFLDSRFSTLKDILSEPKLVESLKARLAGAERAEERFEFPSSKVIATLPAIKARPRRSVRITLRLDSAAANNSVLLRFRRGEDGVRPVSPRKWNRLPLPESARAKIVELAGAAFAKTTEAHSATVDNLTITAVNEPISWPYPPVAGHPMGLDESGRDVYSRIVHGARISMLFGLVLVAWAIFGGIVFGALQGYFGGWVDIAGQRITEIWSAIPFLYVMIFIGPILGRSFAVLLICYGLFNWIGIASYMRAEFLRLRRTAFVEAAKCRGISSARIVFSHILPNALTPLITLFPFCLIGAIASLAALDFLGFGLPPLTPSWGELLKQAQQYRDAWWLILFPATALFTVMFLSVLVGEGLRDAFDPRAASGIADATECGGGK